MPNSINKMVQSASDLGDFWSHYSRMFQELLESFSMESTEKLLKAVLDCQKRGGTIYTLGNGGSALNAQHVATGLSYITKRWDNPIRCKCLCDNVSNLTSLSNDYGFEHLFEKQLEVHWKSEDLALFLSTSGNSQNLLLAAQYVKNVEGESFGIIGNQGGELASLMTSWLKVPTPEDKTLQGTTEDLTMIFSHMLCYYLEFRKDL